MRKNPEFTIIVPVYNSEKYLRKCIGSILSQTMCDFELILIDDGSIDSSPGICDEYDRKEDRVQVIHKHNGGVDSARTEGIKRATGEYIICVDSDDWINPDYLLSFQKIINHHMPDIIVSGYTEVLENKIEIHPLTYKLGLYQKNDIEEIIYPKLIQAADATYFSPSLWGKAFKRELLRQAQVRERLFLPFGEDAVSVIQCILSSNNIYFSENNDYCYRNNQASVTNSRKPVSYQYPINLYRELSYITKRSHYDFKDQVNRKIAHEVFGVLTSQFYARKKYRAIKEEILCYYNNPIIGKVINDSDFSGSIKAIGMSVSLKHKAVFPMYILSIIRGGRPLRNH